jgi:hypothetical protein
MRTTSKVMTVTAASILIGLTGMASAANAAESSTATGTTMSQPLPGVNVTPSSATEDEMSANKENSTRQFKIMNFTGHVLTVSDVWGTTGWPYPTKTGFNPYDEYHKPGSVLNPGQQMVFEVKDWSDHGITVKFRADNGQDVHVYMHVSGLSRYSDARGLEGQFIKGGGDVTILDKPGVVTIPASDPAGQAKTINTLCVQSAVTCTFTPTKDPEAILGPPHPFGRGFGNVTQDPTQPVIKQTDTVEASTSLALSASVKATIMGAVEMGLTTEYKEEWKTSHGFIHEWPYTVRPGHVGWLTAQEPMQRVTGDFTITMKGSQTSWTVNGLVFDLPDHKKDNGLVMGFTRAMTDEEITEAWRTGGMVQAPWKHQFPGVAVQAIPEQ